MKCVRAAMAAVWALSIAACGGSGDSSVAEPAANTATNPTPVPGTPAASPADSPPPQPAAASTHTVGGTVTGLTVGTQLQLLNNGGDPLTLGGDGPFTFATPIAAGGSYAVTVSAQPVDRICSVAGGSGSGAGVNADVTGVSIVCAARTYTIGGQISGLANGQQVTLTNNGSDALTVAANGAFTFATPVARGGSYAVSVGTAPSGSVCAVAGGSGNAMVADVGSVRVACAVPMVTRLAGGGFIGDRSGYDDGPPDLALFDFPSSVVADANGNLFVADRMNNVIRRVDPQGTVSTFAGGGSPGGRAAGFADGQGTSALFSEPIGLALDGAGNLYVADFRNGRIRIIDPSGNVSTFAGGNGSTPTDGPRLSAGINGPWGLAFDASGRLYFTDRNVNLLRRVEPNGNVVTVAGGGGVGGTAFGHADGPGRSARFWDPEGITVDRAGNVYVVDHLNHLIRRVSITGEVTTLAGTLSSGNFNLGIIDGAGSSAAFAFPRDIAFDGRDALYVADGFNNAIRRVTLDGVVTTVAGAVASGTTNGTGTQARFNGPVGITVAPDGTLYVADTDNHAIRRITLPRP